jgi:hypothetical protein
VLRIWPSGVGSSHRRVIIGGSQSRESVNYPLFEECSSIVDRQPDPALLPILRSEQQGQILALLLGYPDLELSLSEIAARVGAPSFGLPRDPTGRAAGLDRIRQSGGASVLMDF